MTTSNANCDARESLRIVGSRHHTIPLVCIALAVSLMGVGATTSPLSTQQELSGPAEGESLANWAQRWLDGPVSVISTEEERELYAGLRTVQERLQFIRLFWKRRDTQLHGPANEYLDEFARRVEYSNTQFTDRGPGWDTVFGRIVLVFGVPERTHRELGLPRELSERPAIVWSYDQQLPEMPPNEKLLFVFQRRRWRLYPPSSLGETGFEAQRLEFERNATLSEIPVDYARSLEIAIERSLRNVVNYQEAIDRVRTVVRFSQAFDEVEIPFSWRADVTPGDLGPLEITLTFSWRMDSLIFHEVDNGFATNMVIDAMLSRDGEPVAEASERYAITVVEDELEEGMRSGRVVERRLTMTAPSGRYELQMTLLDQLLGYRTAYRDEIDVSS